ncbi:MAG: tRNA preQ1(34) S-adenosylmethionine ribosyltransferase-isomerase QueA [Acidobacteriaceae bacterium]|nr:tRNA preQ1(34) S-adenosylmethionine ribosyltransferase-isomerase QueA [Acidobacteriaceae bacterium]
MLVSEFDYHLPTELIAQQPLTDRASSRLLHSQRSTGKLRDCSFCDFPDLLRSDDLVVFNNTRVFPARLYGRRSGVKAQPVSKHNPAAKEFLQGQVEVLLTRQVSEQPNEWQCLVHPGRKIDVGEQLSFGDQHELKAEVVSRGSFGERRIRFEPFPDFFALVEQIGHVPLPPYIARPDLAADRERYQTIYARERGSVAAPTAGLHFTPEVFESLKKRGIEIAEITLHVGLGTFQPVRVERVEDHRLHTEYYSVSEKTAAQVNAAKNAGRRVVAIGTTTVRTLEHASVSGHLEAGAGEADIFIYPGYHFRMVDALLTNFHLPKSTLLMLVCALGGIDKVLGAYRHAVEQKYRFYSYGDCMFVE